MLKPQPGFQEQALATPADIAFIGGSAGGGKSWLLEVESCRHYNVPAFGATIFRRTTTQIKAQGGLWDTSKTIFPLLGATPRESSLEWVFSSGAKVKFAHLEHEKDVHNYQGSQIPLIGFDELTHFTEFMFTYMISRNRTDCGIRPYMRGSCNPDPNSWVAKWIEFYINQTTGYPIKEHAGRLRYFTRSGETLIWGDSPEEVIEKAPEIFNNEALIESGVDLRKMVKSFTFIPGSIFENKIFIKNDPGYLGNLLALQEEERKRLLDGNWKISLDGLMLAGWEQLKQIFDNWPETSANPTRAITVDAARFGKDFCVIMVWKGWEVIYMVVYKVSDVFDITGKIEELRKKFSVQKSNVVVDADGVGDGTVKMGGYVAFHNGSPARKEPENRIQINYKDLKTQCYYRFCQKRINTGQVRFSLTPETVEIHDGPNKGTLSVKIKVGTEVKDVRDLIVDDFKTVKRLETKNEGVDKIQIQSKETQKEALKRSPDFSDCAMMREFIELMPKEKEFSRQN